MLLFLSLDSPAVGYISQGADGYALIQVTSPPMNLLYIQT